MITSRQNQRLKDIRRLKRSKGSLALLEGNHLLREAMASSVRLVEVFATPDFLSSLSGADLSARLPFPCIEVTASALASLAESDSPPGVLAVAELARTGVASLPILRGATYLFVDGLQDPGNLGALARVAEAAGAAGMALAPGSASPNHPRALRASAGSLLRLPTAVQAEPHQLQAHLAEIEPCWITLVPRNGVNLFAARWFGTPIVALGAEGPGVSDLVRSRSDLEVTIPMAAPVESLNATVAAALMLFELRRRSST